MHKLKPPACYAESNVKFDTEAQKNIIAILLVVGLIVFIAALFLFPNFDSSFLSASGNEKTVNVSGYTTKKGSYVAPYHRRAPKD